MSRPIKFRGYSGQGVWTYMTLNGDRWDIKTFPLKDGAVLNPKEWQQYTGLLDKNGKEIYQDDIVSIDGLNVKVEWYNGAWTVEYFTSPKRPYLSTFDETDIEIIGNIYENPELLSDNK